MSSRLNKYSSFSVDYFRQSVRLPTSEYRYVKAWYITLPMFIQGKRRIAREFRLQ
jgi:hypothetical protein